MRSLYNRVRSTGKKSSARPHDRNERRERREPREGRDHSTVAHPWLALPERLASAQAAMEELAGEAAFSCPLGETLAHVPTRETRAAREPGEGRGPAQVNVIVRKRRFASVVVPGAAAAA